MSGPRRGLGRRLVHELTETIRNPRRIVRLADPRALRDLALALRGRSRPAVVGGDWMDREPGRFIGRSYGSYDEYTAHQSAKLEGLDLSTYDLRYRELLRERLRTAGHVDGRKNVLCLAARVGTEVKAFHDLGCFAVGIDLNPGDGNRYVLHGDFHDLQFPDRTIDVVFTNSLDHALEPERIFAEVRRVLHPGGLFIAEISRGRTEGYAPREFESFYWERVDDLVALIAQQGFEPVGERVAFDEPWPGFHVTFKPKGP